MVDFVCPRCWARTELPDEWAGKRARCPECHAPGDVPPLQPKPLPPPTGAAKPSSAGGDWPRLLLWTFAAVLFAVLCGAVGYAIRAYR